MELLVTLRNTRNLDKIINVVDGVIIGSEFCSGYQYTLKDLSGISEYVRKNNRKVYFVVDEFISEDELSRLNVYLEYLASLKPDGIYFHDFAVYDVATMYGLKDLLIYDGKSVLCNSLETSYFLSKGLNGVVISSVLTIEEVEKIIKACPKKIDMQIFGHLRLSSSKRKFVTNYLKQIKSPIVDIKDKKLTIVEEQRKDEMPILEDHNGTKIYSDYIFETYNEIPELSEYLNRGIIDTLFIEDTMILQVLRDYRKITNENSSFLKERLYTTSDKPVSSGFLYIKTNITKEDE